MNIQSIQIENVSLSGKNGFVCIEGNNIVLKNAAIYSEEKSVIDVTNSKNLLLDNITYGPAETLIHVQGERSKDIRLLNTDGSHAKKEIDLGTGVSPSAVRKK
jgi:DNA sulfur modification protein DndE